MPFDFDAIVIGSGAGGAAFAHHLAGAGKNVLVVERGKRPDVTRTPAAERQTLIDKEPYDDRPIEVNDTAARLYMGGVLGGGTSLFGAALIRPADDDFHPGKHYGPRLPRELWDWPITYDDLRPFYDEAEELFALAGTPDEEFAPLNRPRRLSADVLPFAPVNQKLMSANRAGGLRPFRLPLAIDTSRCARCDMCAGLLCPHGARKSAAHLLDAAAATGKLQLLVNTEVERLATLPGGRIEGVVVRPRDSQERKFLRARCFALAAGAIGSPALLLRSGIEARHLGRNYMMHYSPIAVGLFARSTGASETFVKQVGFADFYYGTSDCRHKLGLVQSLPAPGPLMLAKSGMKRWPRCALRFLRKRMLPLAGIVEDLPDPANQVFVKPDGSVGLKHRFSGFDIERGRALGLEMCRILRRAGALICSSRAFPSLEHVAHQCGTLRFGRDPDHAVVDADCRLFGQANLFVTDGSVLPTSLGVGPALTIVANSLRVARIALQAT
ncbi:MAG TPA: GMC family oxidoreductase [Pirellulales bacterium]|nr:GMC family oxidoreductase [Pirellulales bacterium]